MSISQMGWKLRCKESTFEVEMNELHLNSKSNTIPHHPQSSLTHPHMNKILNRLIVLLLPSTLQYFKAALTRVVFFSKPCFAKKTIHWTKTIPHNHAPCTIQKKIILIKFYQLCYRGNRTEPLPPKPVYQSKPVYRSKPISSLLYPSLMRQCNLLCSCKKVILWVQNEMKDR